MDLTLGVLALLEAKPEKAAEVKEFLIGGKDVVDREPGTRTWYAFQIDETHFGIFDSFVDEDARNAHLGGEIPKALGQVGPGSTSLRGTGYRIGCSTSTATPRPRSSSGGCVSNYLGFPAGISGAELAERARLQAVKFGATVVAPAGAAGLDRGDGALAVRFSDGTTVTPGAVVVASGMEYRRLEARNLDRFEYTSVYYAATVNEARECGTDPVVVVGGGNSAGQAAVFLAGTASHVHLVVRGADLGRDMSRYLVVQVEGHPRITVHTRSEVVEAKGDDRLQSVIVEHRPSGEREELVTSHLFVFIGAVPATAWLGHDVDRDERGFLRTGPRSADIGSGVPPFETSVPGVFAVGDVRSGSVKRMSAAVGEGASVVKMVHDFLATGGSRH